MTDTSSSSGVRASVPSQAGRYPPEPSGWVGWALFGGAMMVMLGSFHVIQGLVALFNDEYYLVGKNGLLVHIDITGWGWIQIVVGVVVGLAGLALFRGAMWARVLAVILALASAIVNLGFLAAYPIWSAIMIALDVLVIYAVTAHGSELKQL